MEAVTGIWFGVRDRKGAVALLLAVAMLLCHGLYGASHQVHGFGSEAPGQVVSHGTQHHHGAHSAPGGDEQGEGHAGHPDGISYAAALSVVLLAAAFALSLGGGEDRGPRGPGGRPRAAIPEAVPTAGAGLAPGGLAGLQALIPSRGRSAQKFLL